MSDGSIRCFRCQELFVYERYTGTCSLSFYMGEGVELEDVSAKFEDGILRVSLPKKEQNRLPKSNLIVIEKQKCGRLRGERFRSLFMSRNTVVMRGIKTIPGPPPARCR